MGLAPYEQYMKKIKDNLIDIKDDGTFKLNMFFQISQRSSAWLTKVHALFGSKLRGNEEKLTQFHMDLAASIQSVTEEIIIKIARTLRRKPASKICMAGGVALNCVANGKLIKKKIFDDIWIQPASGDATKPSLGAALIVEILNKPRIVNIEVNERNISGMWLHQIEK